MTNLSEFVAHLKADMESAIETIPTTYSLQWAQECHETASSYLLKLKEFVVSYSFADDNEEIHFFKIEQPPLYANLLYFTLIKEAILQLPVSAEDQEHYFQKELKRISHFCKVHRDFITYYRSGATYLDSRYFLRNRSADKDWLSHTIVHDTRFCTIGSIRLARFLSFEKYTRYLQIQLSKISHSSYTDHNTITHNLRWTATKSDLTELQYALYAAQVFNAGKVDIKSVGDWLESTLNIELGNYYRTFQTLRIRKKNRTAFLDFLKDNLIRLMNEQDENPRFNY